MGKSDTNCVKRGNRKDFKILGRILLRLEISRFGCSEKHKTKAPKNTK
jgi:hypothetical protein